MVVVIRDVILVLKLVCLMDCVYALIDGLPIFSVHYPLWLLFSIHFRYSL